jgi:hypothetical protein
MDVIVVDRPTFEWEKPIFACQHCGTRVRFEVGDMRDKSFRARETLIGGWAIRARCPTCHNPLAQFKPEKEAADAVR